MNHPSAAESLLSDEQKNVLMQMVIEVNAASKEWIPLDDDIDKKREIKNMLKSKVHTTQDVANWLNHIEDLDVVDPDNVCWKSVMLAYSK